MECWVAASFEKSPAPFSILNLRKTKIEIHVILKFLVVSQKVCKVCFQLNKDIPFFFFLSFSSFFS